MLSYSNFGKKAVDCDKKFGGKCTPDTRARSLGGCILNKARIDPITGLTFDEIPGYIGNRGCCNPGSDGMGGDLDFPTECIDTTTGDGIGYGVPAGCNVPQNRQGRKVSLYDSTGKEVSNIDKCSNCGKYYYSDGIVCRKLSQKSDLPGQCGEGKIVDDSMCSGLSVLSKSTFGKGSNDLLIPMLVLLVLVVLYLIFNQKIFGKKSSLFGKRR
jgi:hypothetical protein